MAAKDLLDQLEGMVECAVCLEQLKEPRSLPCQHSFCTECLQGLLGTGRKIRCPCCNKETPVPNGVQKLPVDFKGNTLLETIRQVEEAGVLGAEAAPVESCETVQDALPCPVCEEIPTETKNLSCGHHLCENCVKLLLPTGSDTLQCPTCSNETRILPTPETNHGTRKLPSSNTRPIVSQPGATSEGAASEDVNLSQLLSMLKLLTKDVAAKVPPQQRADSPPRPSESKEPVQPYNPRPAFLPPRPRLRPSSPEQMENAAQESRLTFHPNCGENIVIHANQITAHRKCPENEELDALVLTSRHLKPNELFEVRLDKKVDEWSSSLQIGVVKIHSPTRGVLPESMFDLCSRM